jgi:hypothetical protein
METTSIIIITGLVAVSTAFILSLSKSSKDLTVTIKMEDNDYPIKNDDVEELEVKPKRKYKKRTPKLPNSKVKLATKKPVGRPRKTVE